MTALSDSAEIVTRPCPTPGCGRDVTAPKCIPGQRCEVCVAAYDVRNAEERRRMAVTRAEAASRVLVSPGLRNARLVDSSPTIEQMNPSAWRMAREWTGKANLFIYGPDPGVGKTFLARCILNRCIENGRAVAETTGPRFCAEVERFESNSTEPMISKWGSVPVLLLDDIDKGHFRESHAAKLWELFNTRCDANLRTIITSNLSVPDLYARIAETSKANIKPAFDRLKPIEKYEMRGESQR